jgi:cardiolipin synthase
MALRNAALAGVDVRLMVPRRGDSILADLASHSYYKEVMLAGVKIYQYEAGYLHAKVVLADDDFVTIGSTNIDFRSFEQNFEINAFIYDPEVVKQMKRVFMDDLQHHSTRIAFTEWEQRPLWKRCVESLVRLLSPLL